ncbi:putative proline oxidase Put1 [Aspergillus affinis]|uniref:putative proline oxidase Put1 n=1 Tax=Aspergillus affinis TaxID=1070780 RepID=UPI0022FE92FC|nr:proline oxidase Put1 [Aspergillus affinis]KAI9043169.1 proline oxidase Put1 [Aspergillus affinis]
MGLKISWPKRPGLLHSGTKPLGYAKSSSTTPHHAIPIQAASSPPRKAPLSVMPAKTFLRSLLFTSVMSSPLLRPCVSILKYVVESKSFLLSPSKNPIMNYLLRTTIYNHFCAGTNEIGVRRTVQDMKSLGFKGVILGYARESVARMEGADSRWETVSQKGLEESAVEEWKQGNLRTLKMIGEGDYLSVKFTGAGPAAVEALARGDLVPPPQIKQAITELCAATAAQNSRLWIDAEQQVFQPAIDAWTIDLMRQFNRQGAVVVLNTIQAYLKSSAENVHHHLCLAGKEGWSLGIKLVRGAYIAHDIRSRIHDTKADTDRNYNHIVECLLTQRFPLGESEGTPVFPDARLFVATHNAESVRKASSLFQHRVVNGFPTIPIEVGQLQGMADEVSCGLVAQHQAGNYLPAEGKPVAASAVPGVFKCLAWGTTQECLHFLLRRAVENQSSMERTRDTAAALREEARRRIGL